MWAGTVRKIAGKRELFCQSLSDNTNVLRYALYRTADERRAKKVFKLIYVAAPHRQDDCKAYDKSV